MSEEGNQIKITIFGQEYSVKAPADPTYIKKIAEYVDSKMREVQAGFSSFNARKKGDSEEIDVEEKITSLIELIDDSV